MAFMLRDAEKVISSAERFVHPGRRNTLLWFSVVQTVWFANRKVRGAERGTNSSGYPIDMTSRQCPVLAGLRLGGKRPKAVVTLFASRQNCPALGQLTIAILGFFVPFARVLQKDVDASDACG